MSRLNIHNIKEGHRVEGPSNRDLEQKLTYQQLLNFNHDLSKENQQLKNIANRLGQELRNLHSQFDIRPREENNDLYSAINSQPILHNYELTLIPLFEAYEAKIQQFQSGFQTFNQEFINLQKKYIQVAAENQRLRADLTDRTKELVQVYRTGSSQKLGADFSQIILNQINEKQRFLAEQNSRLQKEYQRYKSEGQKNGRELTDCKRRQQQVSSKLRQMQLSHRQLQAECKSLKEKVFEAQMRINELEGEKKKLDNDLQRAMSQVGQLNKDRDSLLRNYESLKVKFEKYVAESQQNYDSNSYNPGRSAFEQTNTQQNSDDTLKKLTKLQKEYDNVFRDRSKIKEQLQQLRVSLQEANDRFSEIKRKLQNVEKQKRDIEMSDIKNKNLMEKLNEKGKTDVQRLRKQQEEEIKRIENEFYEKIKEKQKKMEEIEGELEKVTLQRDKLEQENIINNTLAKDASKVGNNKETQRAVDKLKEKLSINEQLFKQQLQIVQNDNIYLKREADTLKNDNKDKSEEIRRLKQQLDKIKRELIEAEEKHTITIEEIKRVRNQYEVNLRDKERLFDHKIKEIKTVVQESDKRRKSEREKVAEASRQYKRVLQEIRNTYEERIRILENEGSGYNSKVRKMEAY